jgi:hypothetical protein
MASFPLRITADAFEALTAEAQAEILRVLEPHESRAAAAGGGAAAAGGAERPGTPPGAIYPPAWREPTAAGGAGGGAPPLGVRVYGQRVAATGGGASEDPVTPPGGSRAPPHGRPMRDWEFDIASGWTARRRAVQEAAAAGGAPASPRYEVWRQGSLGESLPPRRLDFDEVDAPPPLPEPAGGGWPVFNGVPSAAGLAAGAAAPPSPIGTPPSSPRPQRPQWRTGSCGESGPFIGLSYGWTCELARRMDRWPGVDAFDLKQQMFAELAEEPDLLRDFTEQEVVDGMAYYSWPAERTREMLARLRAAQQQR